ncbi:MAG: hypothetical protein EOP19_08960 [Hyphomicrobiales bacterium]|nr:MAG: hypothetical protein EOP19_08960 [Hyphomicrobiales bacterium]
MTTNGATLELVAGSEVVPVAAFGSDAISLKGRIAGQVEQFTLSIANGTNRVRVPFRGAVSGTGGEVVVATADRERVLSAAAAGLTLDPSRLRSLVTPVAPAATTGRRHTRTQLLAVAACIILAAYVGVRLWDKMTTVVPRVAFLATDVTTLLSPTSGRISFIEPNGAVEAGQPAVGIQTTSGKSLLIDAPGNVEIVSGEKTVGDRIKRGDPLLAYAEPGAQLYLRAVVDRDQAFRIAGGTQVRYSRLDTPSQSVTRDVPAGDLHIRALPFNGQQHLYEVRIPIEGGDEQFRALPVSLRFQQSLPASLLQSLRAIGLLAGAAPLPSFQGDTR